MNNLPPKTQAFINNIRNGQRDTLNRRVYELIKSGIETIPQIETFLGGKHKGSPRINDLQRNGMITDIGVKIRNNKPYSRYVITPEGEEHLYIKEFENITLKSRYETVLNLETNENRKNIIKGFLKELYNDTKKIG